MNTNPEININGILGIDITYACNLKCKNCNRFCNLPQKQMEELSIEDVEKIIFETVKEKKIWDEWNIAGGEPLLHKDFLDIAKIIYKYTSKYGVKLTISTNGCSLTFLKYFGKLADEIGKDIIVSDSEKSNMNHTPYFYPTTIAPIDIGGYFENYNPCEIPSRCGLAVNKNGYFVCAQAGAIDSFFGLGLGIKNLKDLTEESLRNQTKEICKYCGTYLYYLNCTNVGFYDFQPITSSWTKQ